jgi:hypothetical protein
LWASAACWFDAAYAIIMEAPHDALEKMLDALVRASARADPDRETWGVLPEHQRLMSKAAAAANTNPAARRTRGDGRPA